MVGLKRSSKKNLSICEFCKGDKHVVEVAKETFFVFSFWGMDLILNVLNDKIQSHTFH
jgi:hypothetical protein